MPRTLTFRQFCADPASVLDEVCASDEPVIVKRRRRRDVVILSRAEYESLEETAHLLSSPANAKRLQDALYRDPSEYVPVSVKELKRMVENADAARHPTSHRIASNLDHARSNLARFSAV